MFAHQIRTAWLVGCIMIISGLTIFNGSPDCVLRAETSNSEMAGYLIIPHQNAPETYDAGFSMYVAAWPLLETYPGNQFQSGLPGTWMFARYGDSRPDGQIYSDIEGGLGWWRDTRFATETPKFITGGVALNFVAWCNGPGAGKGRDWKNSCGKYGMAQLSPCILWPPDGLNLRQGTCGELLGYGYLPLPLTETRSTTAGKDVPTGDQCWTLFLNACNFKGPVGFFTPFFWSEPTVNEPRLAGAFLDSRPSDANRAIQMETQYVPAVVARSDDGNTYARVAPMNFPGGPDGKSLLVHCAAVYNRAALWDAVKTWFEGGPMADGVINPGQSALYGFDGGGYSSWRIRMPGAANEEKWPIAWDSFAQAESPDSLSYGFHWDANMVGRSDQLVSLPQYYRLEKTEDSGRWVVIPPTEAPEDTGLAAVKFTHSASEPPEPYVTPEEPGSCWKTPGPVAGPFQAKLGDGSVVTYYWYRFADQPSLLNADLTNEEREHLQIRAEMIHRAWTNDRDYLPPPTTGKLADLDPALIVTPPHGLEIGYIPIVTRQEWAGTTDTREETP